MLEVQHKEIRIMYVGNKKFIRLLKNDFLRAGALVVDEENPNSFLMPGNLLRRLALVSNSFPNAIINFYTDVYELAKFLPKFDADLIIIDERIVGEEISKLDELDNQFEHSIEDTELSANMVLRSSLQITENENVKEIQFEFLKSAIEKFTPRSFHYTMRRIVVVLPKEARKTNREFTLSIANVRAVIVDPTSSLDLFLYATKGLYNFNENHNKTSLCFSGGGVEGYLYSVGVAHALTNVFVDKTCFDFDIFCGVSSGAIISSCLAANLPTGSLVKQIYRRDTSLEHFALNTIFDLATGEIAKKSLKLFKAFSTLDLGEAIARFQNAIPIGFFRGEKLKQFIARQMEHIGVADNISALKKELYIGTTDQDTGEYIILGEEPWKDIKISQAVRASTALPTFYLPEKINGHWFSDGQLTGGSGFIHAIQKGAGLVVNIDPMVGYTSNLPGAVMKRGGFFTLIQAVKSIVQSRADSILKHAMDKNPDVDFINFFPTDDVMEAMAGNPMKYSIRTELVDLGFNSTLSQILDSYDAISHKFAKHGFKIKTRDEIANLTF